MVSPQLQRETVPAPFFMPGIKSQILPGRYD
jgi:hypothetical protein